MPHIFEWFGGLHVQNHSVPMLSIHCQKGQILQGLLCWQWALTNRLGCDGCALPQAPVQWLKVRGQHGEELGQSCGPCCRESGFDFKAYSTAASWLHRGAMLQRSQLVRSSSSGRTRSRWAKTRTESTEFQSHVYGENMCMHMKKWSVQSLVQCCWAQDLSASYLSHSLGMNEYFGEHLYD